MTLLAADGSNLGTDLYKGKVEGFLFKADADGNYVGGNGAFYNNTYLFHRQRPDLDGTAPGRRPHRSHLLP